MAEPLALRLLALAATATQAADDARNRAAAAGWPEAARTEVARHHAAARAYTHAYALATGRSRASAQERVRAEAHPRGGARACVASGWGAMPGAPPLCPPGDACPDCDVKRWAADPG